MQAGASHVESQQASTPAHVLTKLTDSQFIMMTNSHLALRANKVPYVAET